MGNRADFCINLFAFTIRSSAWETASIYVSICSLSQFAHLHGKPHRRPFRVQGTHVISIPFWSHSQSSTSVAKTVRLHGTNTDYRTWGTSLAFFLYLPPSICLLLIVQSRFFFATERRRTRAIFERHHARAASEFTGWRSSLPFFFYIVWSCMVCTVPRHMIASTRKISTYSIYPINTNHYKQYSTTRLQFTTVHSPIRSYEPYLLACLAKHPLCARSALPTRYAR